MKKSMAFIITLAIFTFSVCSLTVDAGTHNENRKSDQNKFHRAVNPVPHQYIVLFRNSVPADQIAVRAKSLVAKYAGEVKYVYDSIVRGFSVKGISERQARTLSLDPSVKAVEQDAQLVVTGQQDWPFESGQVKPLDRIDQRTGLNGEYFYPRTGTGVHVYVVDTGVWIRHNDFGGRASALFDFDPSTSPGGYGTGALDDNHGTLSASYIGSKTFGVAKNVQLHSVRVANYSFSCQFCNPGHSSDLVAGLQAIYNDVNAHANLPAVVNISLGFRTSDISGYEQNSIQNAVDSLINLGVTVVAGAGNDNHDVNNFFTPALLSEVITVGATNGAPGHEDERAFYNTGASNFGSLVDIWAPSGGLVDGSYWYTRGDGTNTDYGIEGEVGTSASAPHVAGAAALYLEQYSLDPYNFWAQPAQVQSQLKNNASFTSFPILYMGCDFIPPPASNPIDETRIFIRQHYYDFLNRQPDQGGWDFWTGTIDGCGSDADCIEVHRINASRAFFESIEFQNTGYFVFRLNKISFSSFTGGNEFGGPNPRMEDFFVDQKKVGAGLIVGQTGWEQVLDQNKSNFAAEWVNRPRFQSEYPQNMSNEDFVDKLYATAGVSDPATRDAMVNGLYNFTETRGSVVRKIADSSAVADNHPLFRNPAYVLMQYFGYLRRNPDDPPDNINCPSDPLCGYHFWLTHLNQTEDTFEMVHAFIASSEYRNRFYQPPFCP